MSTHTKLGHFATVTSEAQKMAKAQAYKSVTYKYNQPVSKSMLKTQSSGNNDPTASIKCPFRNPKEDSDTVIITAGDINRIKSSSVIQTTAEIARKNKEQQEERIRNSTIANQRKTMMLKMEAERKKKVGVLSETEKLKKETDALILSKANEKLGERLDDVKTMDSMMIDARCATLRDIQKTEKAQKMKEIEQENHELDLLMMSKALREIEEDEKRELLKTEQRHQVALELRQQIEEAEARRKTEEDLKELDAQRLLQEMERIKEEDQKRMREKQEARLRMLDEIEAHNRQQLERKRLQAQLDKEDEERIQLYHYNKDLQDQQKLQELQRVNHMKEIQIARLRALQEKARDRQAQLDDLRAQRAQEAIEQDWREKQRLEAEKRRNLNEQMEHAREEQMIFKMKQLSLQAQLEQQEFLRIMREQEAAAIASKKAEEDEIRRNGEHKEQILEQMTKKKERMEMQRKELLEEGDEQRLRYKAELQVLEDIKAHKLKQLQKEGVPAKYIASLSRKKVHLS